MNSLKIGPLKEKVRGLLPKRINYALFGFLIPLIGMLFVMLINGFAPFGDSSMLYSDKYHQYYPFFKAFRQALRNGDSLLYSWNVGMGIDYLGLIAYYVASPLNLLSVLLPESWLLGYFELLTPIRLGLAGLFFAIFLQKLFKKNDWSIAIFGSFYAMCAWALAYMWNVMWLDSFALLPLVALGMVMLLKERKFLLYTLSLFLAVFSNYYIGLFVCVFVFLSFICYQICRCKSIRRLLLDLCWIALFSMIAIGMTALLTLPAYSALSTTQSSVNKFPEDFALNIADKEIWQDVPELWDSAKAAWESGDKAAARKDGWEAVKLGFKGIMDGMKQCAGNMTGGLLPSYKEGLPNLYSGIGILIFAFLFLTCRQVKIRDKLCAVFTLLFLLLSILVRQLDYIWHGFHFTNMINYRFTFLFSFILVYMAYRAYLLRRTFRLWQVIVACVLTLGIILCSDQLTVFRETVSDPSFHTEFSSLLSNWTGSDADLEALANYFTTYSFVVYNFLFLLLFSGILIFVYFPRKLRKEQALCDFLKQRRARLQTGSIFLLCIFGLELFMNTCNFALQFTGTDVSNYPRGTSDTAAVIETMQEREADTLFYRSEVTHTQTLNDGALNNYNGISTFTSSANVKITEFMKALGYSAKNTYNRYCYEESSPVANLFLNLKYLIERKGDVEENNYFDVVASSGDVYLLQNNAYLPLGFLTDSALADLDFFQGGNDFALQNRLIQAATGTEADVWTILGTQNRTIRTSNPEHATVNSSTGKFTASANATITYSFTATEAGFMCIDVNQTKKYNVYFAYKAKGTEEAVDLYMDGYSLPQMYSVCEVSPGDVVEVKFYCKPGDTGTLTLSAAILNEERFRAAYEILNSAALELTQFSNTRVEGTINCDRDGLLYTSIPQNGQNWTAYVDGEPAEIVLVGDVMIGVALTKGAHTVTFIYRNKSYEYGLIAAVSCTALLIALWILIYRPKFTKTKQLFNTIKQKLSKH